MKKLIVTLFVNIVFWCLIAQDVKFDYLTVEDGLSQSVVESIFKDNRGLMWFGTRDGLNMYDGYSFKIYRHDKYDTLSLDNSTIFAVNEDFEGNILSLTQTGLNKLVFDQDKVIRIHAVDSGNAGYMRGRGYGIFRFNDDRTIWYTNDQGVSIYYPDEDEWENHRFADMEILRPYTEAFSVIKTSQGRYFVSPRHDFIFEYLPDKKKLQRIFINDGKPQFGNYFLKRINEDNNGNLVIGGNDHGLTIVNPMTFDGVSYRTDNSDILSNNTGGGVIFLSKDEWWIGSDGGGIIVFNPITEEFSGYQQNLKIKGSLNVNGIYNLFQDDDGIIWVGTYGGGVNIWNKYKYKFTPYVHNPDNPNSIASNPVLSVFQDSKGRIWIGNDGSGLNLFDPDTREFKHYRYDRDDPNSLQSNVIVSIGEDPMGNILLGTFAAGLMSFNPETEISTQFRRGSITSDSLHAPHVWSIFRDSKDRIWLGLLENGLDLYDPYTQTFTLYGAQSSQSLRVGFGNVMYINEDMNGDLWFGTEGGGIYIFDEKEDVVVNLVNDPNNENTISGNDVKCVEFTLSHVFIGTNGGGIDILDRETNKFKHFTSREGLPADAVMGFLMDDDENLWISTTKGMCKLDTRKFLQEDILDFKNYDKNDGLAGNEFKYDAQKKLDNGKFIFGGIDGISIFHPDSVKDNPVIPPIVFTDFKLFNKSQIIGAKNSPLKKHINSTRKISLTHKQNVFSIEFAALNYTATDRNHYRYMMEGFDKDWIEAGTQRFAMYTNLNAGKYVFKVQGSNNDGVWNTAGCSIKIRVYPPWYKTWWFLTILTLTIIYLIGRYVRARTEQNKRDKEILQEKINEGQKEIQKNVRELENQKKEIAERDEREKEMRFQNKGLAKFGEIISKSRKNLATLGSEIVTELVPFVEASAGALFIANKIDDEKTILNLSAQFCFDSMEEKDKSFDAGEGYIGTCFTEKKTIQLDNLPESYIKLKSGLGETPLKNLVLVPIVQDNEALGVIELASMEKLPEYKVILIEKLAENLASVFAIAQASERMQEMLEQNQMQAEELKAQEEEMRQNIEEMHATQEESARREQELHGTLKEKEKELEALKKKLKRK
ncbi:MAG: GAF domain-containing protein [Bacteroidales bacterium]|nr:GAF domain-containing protein [Bacteroidales bacterium]